MGDEDPSEVLNKFELLLKNVRLNKTNSVYNKNKQENVDAKFKKPVKAAQDILLNVSSQIQNLHRADTAKNVMKNRDVLFKSNKALVSVNSLPVNDEVNQQATTNASKFETQGFSNSQLLHIIQDAEAIESNSGVTQEFDVTFCPETTKISINEHTNRVDNSEEEINGRICNSVHEISVIPESHVITTSSKQKQIVSEEEFEYNPLDNKESNKDNYNIEAISDNIQEIDDIDVNLTQVYNEATLQIEPATQKVSEDVILSPILKPVITTTGYSKSDSPLVFNLEDFEIFEKIALPIIEQNGDLSKARELINFRINDKLHETAISKSIILEEVPIESFPIDNSKNVQDLNLNNISTLSSDSFTEQDFKMKESRVMFSTSLENEVLNSALEEKIHVKDEILFSSDEEDPYFTNHQDLPFTCALETSFYDQSDILDKTMFVGFQTASNKAIQISSESFYKACSFFNDCASASKEMSLTDLVKKCETIESPTRKKLKDKNASKDYKFDYETEQFSSNAEDKELNLVEKTASSEVINISGPFGSTVTKDVLEKRSNALNHDKVEASDCTIDIPKKAVNNIADDTVTNHKGKNIDEDKLHLDLDAEKLKLFDDDILKEFENDEILFVEKYCEDDFVGFKTASKKNIPISDAAFRKTKDIFTNLDCEQFSKPLPVKFTEENKICIKQEQRTEKFVGFKTASNKNINISEETLAKSKNLFKDIDVFESERMNICKSNNNNEEYLGFTTASNKKIIVSDAALVRSRNIFENLDDFSKHGVTKMEMTDKWSPETKPGYIEAKIAENNNDIHKSNTFQGFKTASNKNIHISETARLACTKIFQDIDMNDNNPVDIMDELSCKGTIVKKFEGFQTASNKPVNVSKAALAKSRMLLKSVDEGNLPVDHEPSGQRFKNEKLNKINKIFNEALKTDDGSEKKDFNTPFKGVITDSIETIEVSKVASNQVRNLSHSMVKNESNGVLKEKTVDSPKFVGFQTARNKPVKISEKALAKSKLLLQGFDDIVKKENEHKDNCNINTDVQESRNLHENYQLSINKQANANPIFIGFQTASNKAVKISDEALAKSKRLFLNLDDNIYNKTAVTENIGIVTESSKKVYDTTEAILKTKNQMQVNKDNDDFISNIKDNVTNTKFVGFQTASKKAVMVSEEALARSKRLFDDLEVPTHPYETKFQGFETASNKKVKVSEEAISKTKDLFKDLDLIEIKDPNKVKMASSPPRAIKNNILKACNTATITSLKVHSEVAEVTHKIVKNLEKNADTSLNTQVLNNFNQTLCTEDFASNLTPVKRSPKRCSSPILSCPRAKKRKRFETPYRNKSDKVIITNLEEVIPKTENVFKFDSNYKKHKRYTLKDICSLETYSTESIDIDPYIKKFNYENLLDFVFTKHRNDINQTELTINDLKDHFLSSVNRKIVPENWFEIHARLILWKLLSYELKFPIMMGGICTAKNVVDQLKYRYDRELYQVQRPALRKILEKDDTSSRVIVLCVVGVYAQGVLNSTPKSVDNLELLLSDGWYTIMASLDKMLCKLVYDEKIKVGSKLVTQGAELVNCEQGIAPWEDTSSVRLKLYGNSTRRARWDARLGFHGNAAILSHLSAVKPDGGKVSKLRLFITRVYPALYVEKFEDGSTVTRSERLEQLYQMKYEGDRQRAMEKIYEEVEKEFSDQESQDSEVILDSKRRCLDTGSQIASMMKKSKDPSEFRATLTSSQVRQLQEHNQYKREQLLQEIQKRVEEKIGASSLKVGRNVVAVLKARVAGIKDGKITNGLLSIWKPNDAISDIVVEGAWIDVSNVVPTALRYSEIHLSAGRQTLFKKNKLKQDDLKKYTENLKRKCCNIKNLNLCPISTAEYNEIDTVGMVVSVEPSSKDFEMSKKQPFQNIFLADSEKKMICVKFWGGLKKFGFELVLDTGQIVACMNLQKRAGNTKKNIPQYRATEFSFFTKTPKNEALRKSIEELVKEMNGIDRRKFCGDCVAIKNNCGRIGMAENNENVSPYRFNASDYNISKNKMFIDSPQANNKCDLNLTGLDFESTFVQVNTQELSPKTLMRKKKLNERIAKLKMYGEPPPLSPMHIINKSKNASSSYKSPLASESKSTTCVARKLPLDESPRSSITKSKPDSSPIISVVNRTFTKNVNPTKLNFSNNVAMYKNVSNDSVDHFAEEFDGSPPLSLD